MIFVTGRKFSIAFSNMEEKRRVAREHVPRCSAALKIITNVQPHCVKDATFEGGRGVVAGDAEVR